MAVDFHPADLALFVIDIQCHILASQKSKPVKEFCIYFHFWPSSIDENLPSYLLFISYPHLCTNFGPLISIFVRTSTNCNVKP